MENLLNFESEGFRNIQSHLDSDNNLITVRTNVTSREEFERWKEIYCYKTNTCFNSRYVVPVTGRYKTFRQHLVCHHGLKHANKKKTSTGCKVQMDVTVRSVHDRSAKDDKLLKKFPCYITIKGQHNHPTQSAQSLGQLRVLPSTKDMFVKYFEQGMTAAQAQRHHLMKMDLVDDLCGQANHSISPTYKSIANMRTQWMKKEHGGLNSISMFDAIERYAQNNQEVTIKVVKTDNQFIVVLVTQFMRRAHKELQEAGEVVFIDATACTDMLNTTVIPLLCAGPAGAVPLGVLFTSSQDEAILTKGFRMIKNCLGQSAFYGKRTPQAFMTDNCEQKRKALAATWPEAQLFLCIFNILQQVWRWLLDSKHRIGMNHRQELMAVMKALVYADSPSTFSQQWDSFQNDPLAKEYPNFTRYLDMLIQRKAEWSIPFRAGAILRGHHTNIFCEATMCIIKELVLSRCKAYNTAQLVVFMTEIIDVYMRQRLMDVALKRRRIKPINIGRVPLDAVSPMGLGKFQVKSESNSETCVVDLPTGMCTCIKGVNGAICNHQAACAEYSMTILPQLFELTPKNRQWLAALAFGKDKVPEESFLKSLFDRDDVLDKQSEQVELTADVTSLNSSHQEWETFYQVSVDCDFSENSEASASLETAIVSNAESLESSLIEVAKKLGSEESLLGMKKLEEL